MSLFRQNVRFVVPRFQRSYVWTRETNWEPLWDDVLAALESVSDEGAPPHFLGAMVVDQQRARTGTTQVRHVIDGQQRLVTLQLLLAAARDVAVEFAVPDKYRAALTKLTVNDDEMSTDPIDVFKVWPTNVDRQPLRDAMSAGSPAEVEALYPDDRPTIVQAYLFFVDQVRAWAGPMSATGRLDAFDRLVATPRQAGVRLREQLVVRGWVCHDGFDGPPSSGRVISECYPYTTLVGVAELGYHHDGQRPRYKRKPKKCPAAQWRPKRAACCDDLVQRLVGLERVDPPLRLRSHPLTSDLLTASPLDDRLSLDAAICAWTAALWHRHGLTRCQVLGLPNPDGTPAATVIAPAVDNQRCTRQPAIEPHSGRAVRLPGFG